MAEKFGRLALHTWTIDTTPLATALDAIGKAGYAAAELRRLDFKRCYEAGMTNDQVLDLIGKSGVTVGVLGVEYGWLFATGDEGKRLFADFREILRERGCASLRHADERAGAARRSARRRNPPSPRCRRHRRRIRAEDSPSSSTRSTRC